MEVVERRLPGLPLSDEEKGIVYGCIVNLPEGELRKLFPDFLNDVTVAAALTKMFLPQRGPAAGAIGDIVEDLVKKLGAQLRTARDLNFAPNQLRYSQTLPLDKEGNLNLYGSDPGNLFPIRGREETLVSLMEGAGYVFANFMDAAEAREYSAHDMGMRDTLFNAVIAYPGAGKSSIGRDFAPLWKTFWDKGDGLECLKRQKVLNGVRLEEFSNMVRNSCSFNWLLYHNIDDCQKGGLYPLEMQLAAEGKYDSILALRFLYASITTPRPTRTILYEDMLATLGDTAKMVTLKHALQFFRRALEKDKGGQGEQLIFTSLFIDEINGAKSFSTFGSTWIQEALSSYAHSLRELRETNVLLIIVVACTRHDAASLELTVSRETKHQPIPVRTLDSAEAVEVVTSFFQKLAITLGKPQLEMNDELKWCVTLSGGMPRVLSYIIRGMLTNDSRVLLPARKLYEGAHNFNFTRLRDTINNVTVLIGWDIEKYRTGSGFTILASALWHAELGKRVYKSDIVVQGSNLTWGQLEQRGLVSLEGKQMPLVRPQLWRCRVRFPPLLAVAIWGSWTDQFGECFPAPWERGFRQRERDNVSFLVFMTRLFGLVKGVCPLRLDDIIPHTWHMRPGLESLKLKYPAVDFQCYQAQGRPTAADLRSYACGHYALLSSGNFGFDSVVFIDGRLILTQSRSSDEASTAPASTARSIFWSCLSDLIGIADLSALTALDLADNFPMLPGARKDVNDFVESRGGVKHLDNLYLLLADEQDGQINDDDKVILENERRKPIPDANLDADLGTFHFFSPFCRNAGLFPLDKVVYIYFSDHTIKQSEIDIIMKTTNPLFERMVIKKHDDSSVFDTLSRLPSLPQIK